MTRPFVRAEVHVAETDSTSDLARRLIGEGGHALPLLVRADRQTRGRGRGSNAWWSDGGSLLFTLALDPATHGLTPAHEPRLALAAAVAVVESVARHVPPTVPLGVRWPNDVEAGGRKLAGVLPERVETAAGPRLLVGIGLNVRTRLEDAPPEVRGMAASLAGFTTGDDPGPDPGPLLDAVLGAFAAVLGQLSADAPALAERWAALDTLRGRMVRVRVGPHVVTGVGAGIDAEGALRVADGAETHRLFAGQVLRGE